jgi:hypothetical protein
VIRDPLRKTDFSCSQNHPDLESRLTFQEKGVLGRGRKRDTATEWSEPPFKPEKPKKNETQLEAMQRRNRDLVRSGRAISSNLLQPPTPRPPRLPGQQRRRFSGSYWYWG